MKKKMFALFAAAAMLAMPVAAQADVVYGFEFNTAGDTEGWTHNGANGGGGGTDQATAGSGEGVLTAAALPNNGDLRVLHNPDLTLDTALFTGWDTVEVRFRQLDGLNGSPQDLAGNNGFMFFGAQSGGVFNSINGSGFVREDASDSEFWYTAEVDISSFTTADITQIRVDPLASTTLDYQIDYVRVNGFAVVPEPTSLAILGFAGLGLMVRRRK
jgi:hypothetical protein